MTEPGGRPMQCTEPIVWHGRARIGDQVCVVDSCDGHADDLVGVRAGRRPIPCYRSGRCFGNGEWCPGEVVARGYWQRGEDWFHVDACERHALGVWGRVELGEDPECE
jgi:hypothetical protein